LFISVDKFRQNLTWRIPMKIASILAGVAVAALTVTGASAQSIHKGQSVLTGSGYVTGNTPYTGTLADIGIAISNGLGAANAINAANGNSVVSSWHAVGNAVGDTETASLSDGATFSLKGAVSRDCAYYSGNNNTESFDFGTLGIYTGDNTGPNAAFTMVAPATLSIQTNLAGCNTNNTVTLSRAAADMTSDSTSGFDNDVFTNKLPYSVTASYQGATQVSGGGAAVARTLLMAAGDLNEAQVNGAWKSPMNLTVLVPTPSKALLAGNYTSSFSVLIAAQ